jgi:hypothetical protein
VNRAGFAGDSKTDKDESHRKEQYGKSIFARGSRPRGADGDGGETSRFLTAPLTKVSNGPVVLFDRRSQFRHKQCTQSYLVLAAARFADI